MRNLLMFCLSILFVQLAYAQPQKLLDQLSGREEISFMGRSTFSLKENSGATLVQNLGLKLHDALVKKELKNVSSAGLPHSPDPAQWMAAYPQRDDEVYSFNPMTLEEEKHEVKTEVKLTDFSDFDIVALIAYNKKTHQFEYYPYAIRPVLAAAEGVVYSPIQIEIAQGDMVQNQKRRMSFSGKIDGKIKLERFQPLSNAKEGEAMGLSQILEEQIGALEELPIKDLKGKELAQEARLQLQKDITAAGGVVIFDPTSMAEKLMYQIAPQFILDFSRGVFHTSNLSVQIQHIEKEELGYIFPF
ncbi:hypothetical protein PPO43_01865 [Saprospira sp. CCB-QB6]|uniref:hypothetical protein n=1 Tax=Saprospira sp. CCB-QB6 TaxID=3023936 RepID=UPI00234A3A25|nr:hypothetical protein [Saprospira sp. CCB-QB6]WCL81843.1 hypothetical protein PPO43_01865 [Saprospira sp. CCB-QB6]